MPDWITQNKEWLFSGLIVAVAGWIITWIITARYAKKSDQKPPETTAGGDTLSAGRDINLAKDGGKTTIINNSTVGVVGDNAKIKNLNVK